MKNYSCYTKNSREYHKQNPFDDRFVSIRYDSDFIGLSKLDYREEKLVRDSVSYRTALEEKRNYFSKTDKRRVFISHKMKDKAIAVALANQLDQNGISYWLDVLDPQLSRINITSSEKKAMAIANIIELALLNCTDIVAIMTNNSYKSHWIPYEYGRAKEPKLQIDEAIAMTHKLTNPIPEYMYLDKIVTSENSVVNSIRDNNSQNFRYSPPKNAFASS